jgi:hypothetical protein
MSHQQTTLTVTEGGIPPQATQVLNLVGAAEQAQPSTSTSQDARIATVPVGQSLGIPYEVDFAQPANWPEARGIPRYRPLNTNVDMSDKPMGQNNVEYTFLIFMFTGVATVGVSDTERAHTTLPANSTRPCFPRLRTTYGDLRLAG